MLADFVVVLGYQLFQILDKSTSSGKSPRDVLDHNDFEACGSHTGAIVLKTGWIIL